MKHALQLTILAFLLTGLSACQESGGDAVKAASESPQTAAGVTQTTDEVPQSLVELFDSDMSKKGCEILTAELVAATFDVPADALKQFKILGCRYNWDNETETLEAGISMLRVYDSEEAAGDWFASATKSRTAEEMKAQMEQVAGQMEKSEQLDTDSKKSAAKGILASIGSKAVHFEDVNGIGDEARVNDDGTVYVRVGNLTFMVSAYKGPKAPPMDLQGVDLQQMAEIAKEHSAQWAAETATQRKADGARLAGAITREL